MHQSLRWHNLGVVPCSSLVLSVLVCLDCFWLLSVPVMFVGELVVLSCMVVGWLVSGYGLWMGWS